MCILEASPAEAEEIGASTIIMKENTGGYAFLNKEKIGFATFLKGQSYRSMSEDEHYFHIDFGNDRLSIDKKHAEVAPAQSYEELPKGTSTVRPTKRIHVLSQPKNGSPSLGFLNPGNRIPYYDLVDGYYAINFGGAKGYIAASQTTPDNGIPVLMYHHMMIGKADSPFANNHMTIDYQNFEEQMLYLKEQKWRTISMQQLEDWLLLNANLPDKAAAITFDDGISSTVDLAYPLMKHLIFVPLPLSSPEKLEETSNTGPTAICSMLV